MAIVRELVTLLRYQVDRTGLTEYAQKARSVGQQVSGVGRAAMQGWREGVRQALTSYGLVPGKIWQGIREQRRLNAEQRKSARNVKEIGGGYNALAGYVRGALAYVGVTATAGLADEWAGVEARIGLVTDSIERQQDSLESLYATAQSAGQDYLSMGDLFYSIQRNAKELDLTAQKSLRLSEIIGKTMTIGGGPQASQQAALVQLSQALGSGQLRGQELRSVLEQAPRLAQAIAEAFGVPVGQLIKLGEQGELTSKDLAEGLLRVGEKIDAEFERMPKTFGRGATLIRNAWGRMIWQLNRASAASEGFYAVSKLISANMKEIVKIGAMALLAAGVMRLLPLLKKMRGGARAVLLPFLRMYAILEAVRLIGDDVLTWLRGGRSVLGGIIGRSEDWKEQIDWVKGVLETVKGLLGDAGKSTADFAKKWGTVGLLLLGVGYVLKWLMGPVVALGRVILTRIVAPLIGVFFAAFGWPGIIAAALVAIVALMVAYWDDIERIIKGVWDNAVKYFTDKWDAALNWLGDKLKAVLPDGLVVSREDGQRLRDERGSTDPRNPWALQSPNMGALQRGGGANISQQDNRQTSITIQGVPGNPAAVGRAAEEGVRRGYGASGAWGSGYVPPNAEAMP